MKETKSYLKARWDNEQKSLKESVINILKHKGDLTTIGLPITSDGLIDLRGYSAPKQYQTEKSNSGRDKTYVAEGIRVKNINFEQVDLSFSDFERCEFFNCFFRATNFKEGRFFAANFWGCGFENILFYNTNFSYSTFHISRIWFKITKVNFKKVSFQNVNFSEVHMHDQTIKNCEFKNCKTGGLLLNKCRLSDLTFLGTVKSLFISQSRKIDNVDFTGSTVTGLKLEKQSLNGFNFPNGNHYFLFKNKSQELHHLNLPDNLSDKEVKLMEQIKYVWTQNNLDHDFVDINWLKEDEIETGQKLINKLKKARIM